MALFTPTNQKRLTNVAVVRLKKGGNRYELACYPNKVKAWRDKLETNLDEVLQAQCVFSNVSKGQLANRKEMFQAFRMDNESEIIRMILEEGELNLTEKERQVEQRVLFRDVAKIVSERCVNPETNRSYTVTMIEKMMKDCHISLKANKTAKQHALEVIKQLRANVNFKIAPAMMELVISVRKESAAIVLNRLAQLDAEIVRQCEGNDGVIELAVIISPDKYGTIESTLRKEMKGKYCIEIVSNTCPNNQQEQTNHLLLEETTSIPSSEADKQIKVSKKNEPITISEINAAVEQDLEIQRVHTKGESKSRQNKKKQKKHNRKDDWPDD